jgi:hypothetical protein
VATADRPHEEGIYRGWRFKARAFLERFTTLAVAHSFLLVTGLDLISGVLLGNLSFHPVRGKQYGITLSADRSVFDNHLLGDITVFIPHIRRRKSSSNQSDGLGGRTH